MQRPLLSAKTPNIVGRNPEDAFPKGLWHNSVCNAYTLLFCVLTTLYRLIIWQYEQQQSYNGTKGAVMPISKLGQRRQVVIPKNICDALGLQVGDFVEVRQIKGTVVIKPKKLVDADDVLTPEEEVIVRRDEAQLRRGEYVTLEDLEHALDRPAVTRRRKPT